MAASNLIFDLPSMCLLLFLLLGMSGLEDQQLVQPHDFVSVITGESLELECLVAHGLPPGPVKWFLGNGPNRKLIYPDKSHKESKRVTRHQESSDTDFTIILRNVTPEDAGMYYCVKQKKEPGAYKDWKSGQGTQVVVRGEELSYSNLISLCVGLCLMKVITAFFLLYLFLRKERSKTTPGYTAGST